MGKKNTTSLFVNAGLKYTKNWLERNGVITRNVKPSVAFKASPKYSSKEFWNNSR
jgi:hypothetical protein